MSAISPSERYVKVAFAVGMMPSKWFQRFEQRTPGWKILAAQARNPIAVLVQEQVDISLCRLDPEDVNKDIYHYVQLYEEQAGVAVPKDHPIALFDSVQRADLEDEMILYEAHNPQEINPHVIAEHLQVVAANVGIVLCPRPLLRALNVRGTAHCDLSDGNSTPVGLLWKKEKDTEIVQNFVGICRGRRTGTSRS